MQAIEGRDRIRAAARAYETSLPAKQRKLLGQFFTGMHVGKLLAHLALEPTTRTVLDPMAGHGDLLDAVWEAADERSIVIKRLEGIEIDGKTASACRERLSGMVGIHSNPERRVLSGSAFNLGIVSKLRHECYDLVITNPPYVRYQTHKGRDSDDDNVRAGLAAIASCRADGLEKNIWQDLIRGYSGLADLSIPAWLLAGLLVRAGGRLALVVPATWRSRDYADVIRYMLLRCFVLEYVVEDAQPGWFDGALVRTHLVVARRLSPEDTAKPLRKRIGFASAKWIRIDPEAASDHSLVGRAFDRGISEADMVEWICAKPRDTRLGIKIRSLDLRQEWMSLETRAGQKKWHRCLEGPVSGLGLTDSYNPQHHSLLPDEIKDVVGYRVGALVTLDEAGIQVGQGLRTGCNRFFYVTECSVVGNGMVRVQASHALGNREFTVPKDSLRPVLRNQSDVQILRTGRALPGRVLDLRGWMLPEDAEAVAPRLTACSFTREDAPRIMPPELADFVRFAAAWSHASSTDAKRIPDMSAVRTNVRTPSNGNDGPRFWYMLPNFTSRHTPSALVARVNHGHPWAEANLDPPVLVDANFCTLWPAQDTWTNFSLKALFNSTWCRALMECLGTRLGGGALKLEASHLRRILIPRFSREDLESLHTAGEKITQETSVTQRVADCIVLRRVLGPRIGERELLDVSDKLAVAANKLLLKRQRMTP